MANRAFDVVVWGTSQRRKVQPQRAWRVAAAACRRLPPLPPGGCPAAGTCCLLTGPPSRCRAGATGFTGRLVAEHLARDYKTGVKWAMAGRK